MNCFKSHCPGGGLLKKKIRKNHCIYIQSCIHNRYQASFHSWHQWSNFAWKPCVSINANSWRWLILSAFLWLTLYCPSMHLGEWQWQCITYQPYANDNVLLIVRLTWNNACIIKMFKFYPDRFERPCLCNIIWLKYHLKELVQVVFSLLYLLFL